MFDGGLTEDADWDGGSNCPQRSQIRGQFGGLGSGTLGRATEALVICSVLLNAANNGRQVVFQFGVSGVGGDVSDRAQHVQADVGPAWPSGASTGQIHASPWMRKTRLCLYKTEAGSRSVRFGALTRADEASHLNTLALLSCCFLSQANEAPVRNSFGSDVPS